MNLENYYQFLIQGLAVLLSFFYFIPDFLKFFYYQLGNFRPLPARGAQNSAFSRKKSSHDRKGSLCGMSDIFYFLDT